MRNAVHSPTTLPAVLPYNNAKDRATEQQIARVKKKGKFINLITARNIVKI